jgi:ribosomal protein S6--L-glutamate ligase
MRLAVLSRLPELYSTRRLVEAATARGHDVTVVDYLRCELALVRAGPAICYRGEPLPAFDAAVPRIGTSLTAYGTAVVRQLELAGVTVANTAAAIARVRERWPFLQRLAGAGLPTPASGFVHMAADTAAVIASVGGPPVVVKLCEGSQGMGVVLAETQDAAEAVVTAFRRLKADVLVQEYIAESAGTDLRALVVGEAIVAAIRRTAQPGEFRANLHRGGTAEAVNLTSAERDLVMRAATVSDLDVAGVDFVRSRRGPLLTEVNASPGLEGIETATGADAAGAVVAWCEQRVQG